MKRYLVLLATLLMTFSGFAQIQVENEMTIKKQKIATLLSDESWLYYVGGDYFLVACTDNQFDDWFWILLGHDKESAIKSCDTLIEKLMNNTRGYSFTIDNMNEKLLFDWGKGLGAFGVYFWKIYSDDRAGMGRIRAKSLEKAKAKIQAYRE